MHHPLLFVIRLREVRYISSFHNHHSYFSFCFSGLCSVKRQGGSIFKSMEKATPKEQSTGKRRVALRSNLHSSGDPNSEIECGLHCYNFNMYYRMGWWVCSSNILKNGYVWEELQARAFLLRQSKKTSLLNSIYVDLLHLFCFPIAHIVSYYLGNFQLCTCCFRYRFGSNNALVAFGCKKLV